MHYTFIFFKSQWRSNYDIFAATNDIAATIALVVTFD